MVNNLVMDNLPDWLLHAKDLIDKQLVYQNKCIDTTWMDILGEPETNS